MSDPATYTVNYSFSGFQANSPTTPLPAPPLDNEFSNIQTSVKSLVSSVMDVRRSDGALNNSIVTLEALAPEISLMFDAGTTANATLLANAVASASASAVSAAASLAAAQAIPATDPALLFAGAVLSDETILVSAATTDIGAATTTRVRIDNTVAISSFGTVPKRLRFVRFTNTLTLTHNPLSLILIGGISRVVSPGDQIVFMSDSSGNWREFDSSSLEGLGTVPLGGTLIWWDDVLPANGLWAWANGSTVSAASVAPQLLARWGSKFGGDGITTMGVPDLRDTVPVGKSTMGGVASRALQTLTNTVINAVIGLANTVLVKANIPPIPSTGTSSVATAGGALIATSTGGWGGQGFVGGSIAGASTNNVGSVNQISTLAGTSSVTSTGTTSTPFNNVQPSTTCNYIVRIA